jgi:hypothetical protein
MKNVFHAVTKVVDFQEGETIGCNEKSIRERMREKSLEGNNLLKKMSYEERLYCRKKETIVRLKHKLSQYAPGGNSDDQVENIKKEIEKYELEIRGIQEGNITLEGKPKNMTKNEVAKALTTPKFLNDDKLRRELVVGSVKKKNPITGKKLLLVTNSPLITQYLNIVEEIEVLNDEKQLLDKQELEREKLTFIQTYYDPIINRIVQMIEKAYKELEMISVGKDKMMLNYNMTEKAAMETLPYEERRGIEDTESRIMQMDEIYGEMVTIYNKMVLPAETLSGFKNGVSWLQRYINRKKAEERRYPVVKQLFID